ncbi:neurofilament light polypeptide [Stegostoma tigrinum]|uniref:neurofilament light polypeptide n=1 Tax=Stegostoma tigrinum TaxID=3053191 RepID=UPI00202B18C5|nr:neurofilament light polypeptide [Stegostoma tigrinum]
MGSAYEPFSPSRKPWDEYRRPGKASMPPAGPYSGHRGAVPKRSARASPLLLLPPPPDRLDLSQVSSLNAELLTLRAQEREQLVDLNDRFASYIEKVHLLEQRNKVLLVELEALRQKQSDPSRLHLIYEQEIRALRALLDSESGDRARMEADRDHLREVYTQVKDRYQQEVRRRLEAEDQLQRAREGADRAVLASSDLEGSVGSLLEEIAFLRKVHGQESAELASQVRAAHLTVEVDLAKPDLSLALREIRAQYEKLAQKNMQAAEDWYRAKFASVSETASRNSQAVRSIREETAEYHRLLQSRGSEIDGLKGVVDCLHKQLEDLEERQGKEVRKYQERISELEKEINDAKQEMARYLREYQDLLNVKMALDIEIAAYRKLLEGEEFRLSFSSLQPYS